MGKIKASFFCIFVSTITPKISAVDPDPDPLISPNPDPDPLISPNPDPDPFRSPPPDPDPPKFSGSG